MEEAPSSETVTTPIAVIEVDTTTAGDEQQQNGNCTQIKSNNSKNINNRNNNNFKLKNKKLNNRRRKRSFRSRKNSGMNFRKNRDVLFNRDQVRRHQLFFSDSQRLVPYNTNEFLMEDHYPKISPNFNYNPSNSHDSFSSSDCMSGSIDEDEFLTKEFRIDYENLRVEQLHEMTKEQLIQEYMKLENQTELSIKSKENEIVALNNKVKDLIRRLKQGKSTTQTSRNNSSGDHSSDSSSSDSDSDSSSSSGSSSSSSDSEMENGNEDVDFNVITESIEQPAAPIAVETASC